ncbi:MAG: RNA-binding protein [bacterium]|jgi:RNA-binding protein
MNELTGKQKRHLRALAHHLKPVLQLGKAGVTDTFLISMRHQLEQHELIKVKVLKNSPEGHREAGEKLAKAVPCYLAQVIGKTMLFYRAREKDPEILLPS